MSGDIDKQTFRNVRELFYRLYIGHLITIFYLLIYNRTAISDTPWTLVHQFITCCFKYNHVNVRCQPSSLTDSANIVSWCRQIIHNCIKIIKFCIGALYVKRWNHVATLSSLENLLHISQSNVIKRREVFYFVFRALKGWQQIIWGVFVPANRIDNDSLW